MSFLVVLYLGRWQKKYFSDAGEDGGEGSCTLFLPPFPMLREAFLWSFVIPLHSIRTIFANIYDLYCSLPLDHAFASFSRLSVVSMSLLLNMFDGVVWFEQKDRTLMVDKNYFCLLFSSVQIPFVTTAVYGEWTNYFISWTYFLSKGKMK